MRRQEQGATGPVTPELWQRREPLYPFLARLFGVLQRVVYDVRVVGGGVPLHGPVLVAANHIAHLDSVVLGVTLYERGRKTRFLAVSDLWSVPVIGWMLHRARMVPVHRGGGPERMTADACAALSAGEGVLVYPEGTIAHPAQRLPARPGAGLLALRTSGPVIPVAVWGLGADPVVRGPLRRRVGVAIGRPVDLSPWIALPAEQGSVQAGDAVLRAVRALRPAAERAARGTSTAEDVRTPER